MTLADIIKRFRLDRDDLVEASYLWSTKEIRSYLTSAMNEACERALLIEDRTTAACCTVTLVAAQHTYALNNSVIQVKRVTYDGVRIGETSIEQLDSDDASWESRLGAPTQFVMMGMNSMRLVPAPTADTVADVATVQITVYRKPLLPYTSYSDTDAELEIPGVYHERLLEWMYRCALMKNDTEAIDLDRAANHERIFEAAFGVRPDANVQRKRRDRRLPVTRYVW